jgi:hypothetical protein
MKFAEARYAVDRVRVGVRVRVKLRVKLRVRVRARLGVRVRVQTKCYISSAFLSIVQYDLMPT